MIAMENEKLRENELTVISILSGMIRQYNEMENNVPVDIVGDLIIKTASEVMDICEGDQPDEKEKCSLDNVSTRKFSKEDLKKAWLHGCVRAPQEMKHLNNFDDYFKHTHGK